MKIQLSRERINSLALFLLLTVCYAYFFPRWADPNQNSRLDMVVAIVDDGTFQIDKYVANTVDYARIGDHYYSDKAPGTAFLGVPAYAALRAVLDLPMMDKVTERLANSDSFQSTLRAEGSGVLKDKVRFALAQVALSFVAAVIPSALIGVMLYRLLEAFTPDVWPRLGVGLIYGLLTPAFAYANAFYGHQLSAALLLGAFFLIFTASTFSAWRLLFVGFLLGYSVITEYPSALMVSVIYLYTFRRLYREGQWRRIGWVTLAGAAVAAGLMVYNKTVFGGWFKLGYESSTLWHDQHDTGFLSLSFPQPEAMLGITFGLFRGLFVLSPILLLAFPGFWLWWKSRQHRAEFFVAVASVLTIYLFNSSSVMWWGGFSVGPRYLLPMLPFLTLPIIFVLRQWEQVGWMRVLITLLVLWSFVATWGMTLAEQAFPPDTILNPWLDHVLPNWLAGNIARSLGTVLGFKGLSSLMPLTMLVTVTVIVWRLVVTSCGLTRAMKDRVVSQNVSQVVKS